MSEKFDSAQLQFMNQEAFTLGDKIVKLCIGRMTMLEKTKNVPHAATRVIAMHAQTQAMASAAAVLTEGLSPDDKVTYITSLIETFISEVAGATGGTVMNVTEAVEALVDQVEAGDSTKH